MGENSTILAPQFRGFIRNAELAGQRVANSEVDRIPAGQVSREAAR
jgi:hypothetical protein